MTYDSWKAHNPQDEFLGNEHEEDDCEVDDRENEWIDWEPAPPMLLGLACRVIACPWRYSIEDRVEAHRVVNEYGNSFAKRCEIAHMVAEAA